MNIKDKYDSIIFDLDGTLLHGDYISERDYFRSVLNKEDAEKFLLLYFEKLCEYENLHKKYDYSSLSKFLSEKTGVNINKIKTPNGEIYLEKDQIIMY